MLGRLAELDAAFEAAQAEKSLWVAEGITRLHGLIGQLEVKRTPQVRPLLTEKLPKSATHGVLTPLFSLILGYREHPKQVCGIWSLPPLCHPERGGAGLGLNIPPATSPPPCFSSQLERNEASPPLRAPRRAGEEPELLPPPTGRSLAGPEGIQRCFGRNSVLLGGIQGYFWRIRRHLGRNTLILGLGGTLGEFQGISGGKDCSREGRSTHSTMLTFSLSFQTRGNPKQSQERGDVPAQKKRVRQVFWFCPFLPSPKAASASPADPLASPCSEAAWGAQHSSSPTAFGGQKERAVG